MASTIMTRAATRMSCVGYLACLFSNEPLISDESHGSENDSYDSVYKEGVTMSNDPDGSSFTLSELLEKALEFGNKASSGSLKTSAFFERACENSPKHTDLSDEILNGVERTKQAYQLLAEVNRNITSLTQELAKPRNEPAFFAARTKRRIVSRETP